MIRITDDERRARIGVRHRLAPACKAASLAEATSSMAVLHGTDAASVFLQARARMHGSSPEAIERELYDQPTVLRVLAMRRTLFLVPLGDVPIIHAAGTRSIAERERQRTLAMAADAGIGSDVEASLKELEAAVLAVIRERGEVATAELGSIDPRLAARMTMNQGKPYEGSVSIASQVVFRLALAGLIGRGRPRGTWVSGQFRWSPIERWLPGGVAERPADEARRELARRWLRAFGPGTRNDLKWWTGWTVADTRRALADAGAIEVALDRGEVGYLLPDDLDRTQPPEPWVALLPTLDATIMGWTDRDWYLGPHRPALFDTAGNAGPTIWVDGRVVGGWLQSPSGEIVPRLLEDVGTDASAMIEAETERLAEWLGPARIRLPARAFPALAD